MDSRFLFLAMLLVALVVATGNNPFEAQKDPARDPFRSSLKRKLNEDRAGMAGLNTMRPNGFNGATSGAPPYTLGAGPALGGAGSAPAVTTQQPMGTVPMTQQMDQPEWQLLNSDGTPQANGAVSSVNPKGSGPLVGPVGSMVSPLATTGGLAVAGSNPLAPEGTPATVNPNAQKQGPAPRYMLKNGTQVFFAGAKVYTMGGDGQLVPLSDGRYEMQSGDFIRIYKGARVADK